MMPVESIGRSSPLINMDRRVAYWRQAEKNSSSNMFRHVGHILWENRIPEESDGAGWGISPRLSITKGGIEWLRRRKRV